MGWPLAICVGTRLDIETSQLKPKPYEGTTVKYGLTDWPVCHGNQGHDCSEQYQVQTNQVESAPVSCAVCEDT